MVRKRPHQALLVVEMRLKDLRALGIGRLRPRPVLSDEVRREAEAVVGVRLPVRHLRVDPRHAFRPAAELGLLREHLHVAEQELVVAFVVARRLRERNAVLRNVREAHPEAVRLHTLVAVAFLLVRIVRLDPRQQTGLRIAFRHIRIDHRQELVMLRARGLRGDAADRLAILRVRFASDGVTDTRRRHEVALVSRVDEVRAGIRVARERPDGHDASVLLDHASPRSLVPASSIQELAAADVDLALGHPVDEDLLVRV